MPYNEQKFKELVLHVARKSEYDPSFGAVKINKVLFLSDFLAYALHGDAITGAEYIRLERGPAPRMMSAVRAGLESEGAATIDKRVEFGLVHDRLVPRRAPDLSMFTAEEIALVDDIVDALRHASGGELSEFTHAMLGWRVARHKEVIPYSTVFLSEATASEEDIARANELAELHEWHKVGAA